MPSWVNSIPAVVGAFLTLANLAICALALGVIPGGRKPSTAMAWLILVLAVPFFGFLMFLMFGSTTVGRKRRAQQAEVNDAIMARASLDELEDADLRQQLPEPLRGFARLNRNLGVLPMTFGNTVELISDYHAGIEAMRVEIAGAEHYVHVQFYISAWDEVTSGFFDELVRAAERGVKVRFLFDHIGSRGIPGYQDFLESSAAPRSPGRRCCRSTRSRARCGGSTCATTARSWSSTDGSRSAARRT